MRQFEIEHNGVVAVRAAETKSTPKTTRNEAMTFLEEASRNWRYFPKLSQLDIEDLAAALDAFCATRQAKGASQ